MNTDYSVRAVERTDAGHLRYSVVHIDSGELVHVVIPHRRAPVIHVDGVIRAVLASRRPTIRPLP